MVSKQKPGEYSTASSKQAVPLNNNKTHYVAATKHSMLHYKHCYTNYQHKHIQRILTVWCMGE